MRRAFDLLRRFLLTLALILAAMPVKANAPNCASPLPSGGEGAWVREPATCAMPCCAAKAVAKMACAAPEHVVKALCPCELRPGPAVAPVPARAFLPTFETPGVAPGSPVLPSAAATVAWAEPGVYGVDSGPPPDPPHRPDFSRAPPVVRA